ncbi:MAG TPA: OsmC family protein [Anaerolineales bacterium]|nr:OsmC family protein [Anaerolineales bacterium]
MRAVAHIHNSRGQHQVELSMGERSSSIDIPPKPAALGSSISGGELLTLALATCYCNDVYREAARMGIEVFRVDVECGAEFPAEGAPARDISFSARIAAKATESQIQELAARADRVAEIQNTVRAAIPAVLIKVEAQTQ